MKIDTGDLQYVQYEKLLWQNYFCEKCPASFPQNFSSTEYMQKVFFANDALPNNSFIKFTFNTKKPHNPVNQIRLLTTLPLILYV